MKRTNWFDVDRAGLAKLLDARGKERVILELVQNAFDADDVSSVAVTLTPDGHGRSRLRIVDDAPAGFANLNHAFTLFAESNRKANPEKRGRFNLGEKLLLALCESAEIRSTTGGYRFDGEGRRATRQRTDAGSWFDGRLRMNAASAVDARQLLRLVIPPRGVTYSVNGESFDSLPLVTSFSAKLPTEFADAEGVLRRSERICLVDVVDADHDGGWIYELGIPIEHTGDRYSYNVGQKVPLGFSRDGVTPAYLQRLRAVSLGWVAPELDAEAARSPWVADALGSTELAAFPESVRAVIELRHGGKAVIADPSDIEATHIAMSRGYEVISGGSYTGAQWANIKGAAALLPAGQVTPSAKPFAEGGRALRYMTGETASAKRVRERATDLMEAAYGVRITVRFADDRQWRDTAGKRVAACYGSRELTINAALLNLTDDDAVNELLIHELAHEKGTHLEEAMLDAACHIGATLARIERTKEVACV